jgi:hypothetical protein
VAQAHVLEWCGEHGLLGSLLYDVHMVTVAPRWTNLPSAPNKDELVPVQESFVQVGSGWITGARETGSPSIDRSHQEGDLVLPTHGPRPVLPLGVFAHVVGSRYRGGLRIEHRPLETGWAPFFPDIPREKQATYPYPAPLSAEFWRLYAEPIDRFFSDARRLEWAISQLHTDNLVEPDDLLNILLARVSPSVTLKDGSVRQWWSAGSLLGYFAMMAVQDVSGGWRMRDCEACGKQFVSHSLREHYCSVTCRRTQQMRRYRKGLRKSGRSRQHAGKEG